MNFFEFQEKLQEKKGERKPSATAKAKGGDTEAVSVSELTSQIEKAIKNALPGSVLVKGEVSNYKHHGGSGHAYFTLKDSNACIDCVMFRSDAGKLKFIPGDGMELLARGKVSIYPQRGRYQLYVTSLQPLGTGALELAFQQLRMKLEAEGLFAAEQKKPIPPYPARIGIITSKETAALQDMLKVFKGYPWVKLFIYHVPVQGDGAAGKIAEAISHLNAQAAQIGGVDLILLGRGGGSLEDLWQFNEEVVARAIVASHIPIISGIGHEVDVSIADLAADYHAHTPTEAARVAMEQWAGARDAIDMMGVRLRRGIRVMVQEGMQRLGGIERHEVFRRPLDRVNSLRQLLDDRQRAMSLRIGNRLRGLHRRTQDLGLRLEKHRPALIMGQWREKLSAIEQRLARGTGNWLKLAQAKLGKLAVRLSERHPRHAMQLNQERVRLMAGRLERAMREDCRRRGMQLEALEKHLLAIGPEQVLKRGYTMTVIKKTGAVLRNAEQIKGGERIVTRTGNGEIESIAEDPKQPGLF